LHKPECAVLHEPQTDWLLEHLTRLTQANGQYVVRLYGPLSTADRGGTVALNIVDPTGRLWNCWHVEVLANQRNLSLRAGCHCNPGAREVALDIGHAQCLGLFRDKDRLSYLEYVRRIKGSLSGVVRVSLGLASAFRDVHRFVQFSLPTSPRPAEELSS
jgi:molybdenum cofactor sulfurtransferase